MNSDFRDLLRAFSEAGVRYLVVGGYAYAEHVEPRYTKDLDVWVERSADNADRVLAALRNFGAPLRELSKDDLTSPGTFYQIGLPPNRIDIITHLEEMDFADCWDRRKTGQIGELAVQYISAQDLMENKARTATPHDFFDWREEGTTVVVHGTRALRTPNRRTTSKPPSANSRSINWRSWAKCLRS